MFDYCSIDNLWRLQTGSIHLRTVYMYIYITCLGIGWFYSLENSVHLSIQSFEILPPQWAFWGQQSSLGPIQRTWFGLLWQTTVLRADQIIDHCRRSPSCRISSGPKGTRCFQVWTRQVRLFLPSILLFSPRKGSRFLKRKIHMLTNKLCPNASFAGFWISKALSFRKEKV